MAEQEKLRVKGTDDFRVPTDNDVVHKNEIIGTDPDANVRLQIKKDADTADGASG